MFMIRCIDIFTQTLNIIGSLCIVAIMVLIGADVIGRGVFLSPISGVPEIVSLTIVAIVFLQLPSTLNAERLTRSDALLGKIIAKYPPLGKGIETFMDTVAIVVMGVIFKYALPLFERAWKNNQFVGAIGDFTAPTWPIRFIILMGTATLILQFVIRILRRHVPHLNTRNSQ